MADRRLNVLVTGGSGYVGQFLLQSLAPKHEVHYTYNTRKLSSAPNGVVGHKADLATGEGLRDIFHQACFQVVINCAAMSQPGACEAAPEAARAVNVPTHLVDCLLLQESERGQGALLIHFSTDQVYDGSHSFWKEDEPCCPVNVYGRTKLEAEQLILARLPDPHHVAILRCSIIYGPLPPDPTPATPFLQFVASALRGGKPTSFFDDEWRNPVYVRDLQRLVELLAERWTGQHHNGGPARAQAAAVLEKGPDGNAATTAQAATGSECGSAGGVRAPAGPRRYRVYNMGGLERLSRVDFARQVAGHLGCGHDAIVSVSSASIPRSVPRPQDISVDMTRPAEDLGFHPTALRTALPDIFPRSG